MNYPNHYGTHQAYMGAGSPHFGGHGLGYNGMMPPMGKQQTPFGRGLVYVQGTRRRMNIVGILIALFLPWLLFAFVCGTMSFSTNYRQPYVAYILDGCALGVCIVALWLAAKSVRQKFVDHTYQPSWFVFIGVTCVAAWFGGIAAGGSNFVQNMQPYYNYQNLGQYKDIDTNSYLGQQLMDAGTMSFKEGTALDIGRSMGFKNHDTYCVAPIVTKDSPDTPLSVDFWAVGKNCCSGLQPDFHCSGFSDPKATGAIRMMQDEDRAFYRLAVQQAEATYKINSHHPIFFQWVHDADEAVDAFRTKGYRFYVLALCSCFTVQVFLTAATSLAFAKLVHA